MALAGDGKNSDYFWRYIDIELDELVDASAIAIDGAKGVGKTETSIRRADGVAVIPLTLLG